MLKKIYIPFICTLMITGCKSNNLNQSKVQNTDNTFVMIKNENSGDEILSEIYLKYEGKDKNKIASNIPASNKIDYLEGKEAILIQDNDNNLVRYNSEGEKEVIGKNTIQEDEFYTPYKVSEDNETIVYLSEDESLYIKEKDSDKEKISSDVWAYEIDDSGKFVYYLKGDGDLYLYSNGNSEMISKDIHSFIMSSDGEDVVFLNNDETLYFKNINSEDKEKINVENVDISSVDIYPENTITFLSDVDEENYTGELYIYNKDGENKISSDVKDYIKRDNKFYYIDDNSILKEKNLGDKKSKKILSDVDHIIETNDGIMYINKDGNVYYKKDNKDPIKLEKNVLNKEVINIGNNEQLIYLTDNNKLFIGEEEIAKDVSNYVYNSQIIAYLTEDKKIYSYNIKDNSTNLEIDNAKEYSQIYLGDQLIFSNNLESSDLKGLWKLGNMDTGIMIIEFSGKNKIISSYPGALKNTSTYEVLWSDEDIMEIKEDGDEISMTIEKIDDKYISMTYNGSTQDLLKISKEEADNILNGLENYNEDEMYTCDECGKVSEEHNTVVGKLVCNECVNIVNEVNNQASWTITNASSILNDGKNISYSHSNVLDGKTSTVWSEGVSGDGIGEWIEISTGGDIDKVNNIAISNGFTKSTDLYYKNNRVKRANLEFSDGTNKIVEFKDGILDEQVIDIGGKETSYIILTILDVYRGNKYQDTCISTISINKN